MYLFQVGRQYGVISNGHQYIIGKFVNIDGSNWKKNKCIIFNGIEDIEIRFLEFYNLLSRLSIIEAGTIMLSTAENVYRKTIYTSLSDQNSEIIRNSLSSELIPVLDSAFGEIFKYEVLDNQELINACFVENEEVKKNKADIEKLFADRPPQLAEVIGARNTKNIIDQIKKEISTQQIGLKDIAPPNPIIIVGSKGSGKTTFINYLFKSALSEKFFSKRPYIYLDFRKYVDEDLSNVYRIIYKDIIDLIHHQYDKLELYSIKVLKRVYLREIKERDSGIWKFSKENDDVKYNEYLKVFLEEQLRDHENHLVKLSHYFLSQRKMRIILTIDNADQFEIEFQKKVFLFAQSLSRKAKCAIILSLREGYYYEWRSKPPFDAFINNVYHISAPPYREVLQKRIDYALNKFDLTGKSSGQYGPGTVEIDNESVKLFLSGLKNSLFVDANSKMLKYLEETTYPNIREGLKIFRDFLLSGHTEVSNYIIRQKVNPDSITSIPFWEFLKATALLNKKYYSHQKSTVFNIFSPANNNISTFLKSRILNYLLEQIENYGRSEKFVSVNHVVQVFTEQGYKFSSIINELVDLLENRLIETDEYFSDKELNIDLTPQNSISISLKGSYYIKDLVTKYSYIELCLQDTPIFNKEYYVKLRESFPLANNVGKRNLRQRYENAILFVEYLKAQEVTETGESTFIESILTNGLLSGFNRVKSKLKYST